MHIVKENEKIEVTLNTVREEELIRRDMLEEG